MAWDIALFEFINVGLSNAFFDFLLPILRDKYTWIPLYIIVLIILLIKNLKYGAITFLFLIACVGLADTMSSKVIKPEVGRLRPCNTPEIRAEMTLRVDCGSGKSMPSSHATNHMALGLFLCLLFYKWKKFVGLLWVLWALAIGFSQIYVGVHYPFDVSIGFILGGLIGFGFYKIGSKFNLLVKFAP